MKAKDKTEKKNRRANLLIKLIVVTFAAFALLKLMQLQMQIDEKQKQIDEIQTQIETARLYNEDLAEKNEHFEQYLEQQLRKDGYVYANDQVYQFAN